MLSAVVWPFVVYYLILFAACYVIVEYGQNYLYDEPTPALGPKVAVGTAILAGLLTWTRTNFLTMFTDDIMWTTLQAIVWFGVFTLIFRFQPWHGGGLGLAAMLILTGLATLAVDSMLTPRPAASTESPTINKPIRRPIGPPAPTKSASPAPAK